MKLRLRSFESKETLKIEVPDPCSLQQLKHSISRAISSSSSSSSSLHLSLNRKDEIHPSSPDDSLHSIGIASGDLVFYTLNPNAFSSETLPHKPTPQEETHSNDPPIIQHSPEINASDSPSLPASEKPPTLVPAEAETTEMVDESDEAVVITATASNSEPSLLKRVVKEALGNDVSDFKLLVLAVHSVILESGFVRVDHVSGMAINCSDLLDEWRSSMISLRYTLPEILTNGSSHTVNLKIQSIGHFVNVCGSLFDDVGSRVHQVYLDKRKFARPLEFMLANSESETSFNDGGDDSNGNEIFELWKMVKDRLALPLLIDICEKAGLDLPPCFTRLPMELKLVILEYLPGVDLAKVCCTSSELRYLASNDELWKKKFEEEFGQGVSRGRFFKTLFGQSWIVKKKLERPSPFGTTQRGFMRYFPRRRRPNPFGVPVSPVPPIWGGDFDLFPGFGLNLHAHTPRRTFIPPCLLGESLFNNGV